jgi:hypothetical protein
VGKKDLGFGNINNIFDLPLQADIYFIEEMSIWKNQYFMLKGRLTLAVFAETFRQILTTTCDVKLSR